MVITDTEEALGITNPQGFENVNDNALEEVTVDATIFSPLPRTSRVRRAARTS